MRPHRRWYTWLVILGIVLASWAAPGLLKCASVATDDPAKAALASKVLWGSLIIALLSIVGVGLAILIGKGRSGLSGTMAEPEWNFSESWAANITLAGALLSTALGSTEMPEATLCLAKNVYAGFSVLFVVLVVLAPLAYTCLSTTGLPRGSPITFLVAGALTEWAVIGQITVLGLWLIEIARLGAFPAGSSVLLRGLPAGAVILVVVYCLKTMYSIISDATTQERSQLKVRMPL